MSHHIRGQGRHQVTLFPGALDDFVTDENTARRLLTVVRNGGSQCAKTSLFCELMLLKLHLGIARQLS